MNVDKMLKNDDTFPLAIEYLMTLDNPKVRIAEAIWKKFYSYKGDSNYYSINCCGMTLYLGWNLVSILKNGEVIKEWKTNNAIFRKSNRRLIESLRKGWNDFDSAFIEGIDYDSINFMNVILLAIIYPDRSDDNAGAITLPQEVIDTLIANLNLNENDTSIIEE